MQFLKDTGVKHTLTVPYNPQYNGIVDRMNRSIGNRIGTHLNQAKLEVRL